MALIDRGRVMADYLENLGRNDSYKAKFEALCKAVDEAPAVDAVPVVHGKWLGEGDGYADGYPVLDVWYCSTCNYCIDDGTDNSDNLPNYCPNCGAKMDGGAEK